MLLFELFFLEHFSDFSMGQEKCQKFVTPVIFINAVPYPTPPLPQMSRLLHSN